MGSELDYLGRLILILPMPVSGQLVTLEYCNFSARLLCKINIVIAFLVSVGINCNKYCGNAIQIWVLISIHLQMIITQNIFSNRKDFHFIWNQVFRLKAWDHRVRMLKCLWPLLYHAYLERKKQPHVELMCKSYKEIQWKKLSSRTQGKFILAPSLLLCCEIILPWTCFVLGIFYLTVPSFKRNTRFWCSRMEKESWCVAYAFFFPSPLL